MTAAILSAPATDRSRVYMDLAPGDTISFGETGVQIEVVGKSGRMARLRITAPRDVEIDRKRELHKVDPSIAR